MRGKTLWMSLAPHKTAGKGKSLSLSPANEDTASFPPEDATTRYHHGRRAQPAPNAGILSRLTGLQNLKKEISIVKKLPSLWNVVMAAQMDEDIGRL